MSELFSWLEKRDEAGKPEYRDLARIWDASQVEMPEPPPIDAMWADLRIRMAEADLNVKPKASLLNRLFSHPLLALAMVLVICLGLWQGLSPLFRPAFSAERGVGQKLVTLDDASVVTMNAGSRLTLSHAFNKKNRNVYLDGEAYFEVEKGAAPFVISAGKAVVKVVGTKFNVYARDGQVRLDVTEGVVEFSTKTAGHLEVVRLHAGESSIVEDGKAPKTPEPNQLKDGKPLWMKDFFDFEAVPLIEVCKVLERRFDITIQFASPDLDNELVEGSLTTKDLDATMNALVDLAGCTYRVTKDGVYMLELAE